MAHKPAKASKMRQQRTISASKPADSQVTPTTDIAASIFAESLTAIRDEIRGIVDGSIKPKGHDKASRIAWLAKNAASVAAEQRKADKGELDAVKRLSPAVILTWIRQQTPEYRARLVRDVTAIDAVDRRSVLG